MATKKITLNELRSLVKQIIKEENGLIGEGLGDAYLDKLFYNEHPYPNTKEKIITFLNKQKPELSNSEKKYYIDRYLEIVKRNT